MEKTAMVTGGARRIGKGIAISLASMGYNIALHYNSSEDDAGKTAMEIESLGVKCRTYKCDLASEKETLSLVPRVTKTFPSLVLLVNNASIFKRAALLETETELFDCQFNINFKAPYFLSRDFANVCKKGQIINILDAKIVHNDFSHSAYILSKKALAEFTKSAAKELAPNIRVNAVVPGMILPPFTETEEYLNHRVKDIPLQKKGKVSYITNAVRFLIEDDFITGQLLFVDGGGSL